MHNINRLSHVQQNWRYIDCLCISSVCYGSSTRGRRQLLEKQLCHLLQCLIVAQVERCSLRKTKCEHIFKTTSHQKLYQLLTLVSSRFARRCRQSSSSI